MTNDDEVEVGLIDAAKASQKNSGNHRSNKNTKASANLRTLHTHHVPRSSKQRTQKNPQLEPQGD